MTVQGGLRRYLQGHLVPGSGGSVQGCHPIFGTEVQVSPTVPQGLDHLHGVGQLSRQGQGRL